MSSKYPKGDKNDKEPKIIEKIEYGILYYIAKYIKNMTQYEFLIIRNYIQPLPPHGLSNIDQINIANHYIELLKKEISRKNMLYNVDIDETKLELAISMIYELKPIARHIIKEYILNDFDIPNLNYNDKNLKEINELTNKFKQKYIDLYKN